MKKNLWALIAILLVTALPAVTYKANAQISRQITIAAADDTLATGADTALVTLTFDGSYKSAEAWIYGLTGTVSGKIVFQGQINSGEWQGLDSLALTDVDSAAQYKLFTVPNPRLHIAYRFKYIKGGTAVAPIKAYYTRYTGGAILRSDPNYQLASLFTPGNQYRDLSKPIISLNFITDINKEKIVGRLRLLTGSRQRAAS